jgi:hypothetical protein
VETFEGVGRSESGKPNGKVDEARDRARDVCCSKATRSGLKVRSQDRRCPKLTEIKRKAKICLYFGFSQKCNLFRTRNVCGASPVARRGAHDPSATALSAGSDGTI